MISLPILTSQWFLHVLLVPTHHNKSLTISLFHSELASKFWRYYNVIFNMPWPRYVNAHILIYKWFPGKKKKFGRLLLFPHSFSNPMGTMESHIPEEIWRVSHSKRLPLPDIIAKVKFWIKVLYKVFVPMDSSRNKLKTIGKVLGIMETCQFTPYITTERWKSNPTKPWILNSNGLAKNNEASRGCILRHHNGDHYKTISISTGEVTTF